MNSTTQGNVTHSGLRECGTGSGAEFRWREIIDPMTVLVGGTQSTYSFNSKFDRLVRIFHEYLGK